MWLLFDPNWRRDLLIKKGGTMKKIIVTLTCLLVAPLAFARPGSARERHKTTAIEPITVTGTIIRTREEGSAAKCQAFKTVVVMKERGGGEVLEGPGHVVNKGGEVI